MATGEDPPSKAPVSRWRTALRRTGMAAAIAVGLLAGLLASLVAALQVDVVGTALARSIAGRFVPSPLTLSVDRVSGSWLTSLTVTGLRLSAPGGDVVARADTLSATYELAPLLGRRVEVGSLHVAGAELRLSRGAAGQVGLTGLDAAAPEPPSPEPDTAAASWRVTVGDVSVSRFQGDLVSPASDAILAWDGVMARARDLHWGGETSVHLDSLSGRLDVPTLPAHRSVGPVRVRAEARFDAGRLAVDTLELEGPGSHVAGGGALTLPGAGAGGGAGALDFRVAVDGFPLALVHAALGNPPREEARLDGTLELTGSTDLPALLVDLRSRSDGGHLAGRVATATGGDDGPVRWRADLQASGIDPGVLTGDTALAGSLNARVEADLEGPSNRSLSGRAEVHLDPVAVGGVPPIRAALRSEWSDGAATLSLDVRADPGTLALEGSARPLDSVPSYDLEGPFDLRLPLGESARAARLEGRIQVQGEGVRPDSARAVATLAFSRIEGGGARLDTATLRAELAGGRIDAGLDARGPGDGTVTASLALETGEPATFRVRDAVVRDLDVAGVLGDSVPSRLDATFTASGAVADPDALDAELHVGVRRGRYGAVEIDTTRIDARLRGGRLSADVLARSPAGSADGRVAARPFTEVPTLDSLRLAFRDLDVSALGAEGAPATTLSGTVTGSARGTSVETLSLDLALRLDSSRVAGQDLEGGTATVVLADGVASGAWMLALADSGRVEADWTARPFAERLRVEVRRLTFAALDPFALAATPDSTVPAALRTSLHGSATGTLEGLDPASLDADLSVRLDPSRIQREAVDGGRLEVGVHGGRLDADAEVALASGRFTASGTAELAADTPSYTLTAQLRTGAPGRLVGRDSLPGRLDALLEVEGRGTTMATLDTRVRTVADSAALGDLRVDTLRLAARIRDGALTLDTLRLRSNVARVDGTGAMALSDTLDGPLSDLSLAAEVTSLAALEPWVALRPLGIGSGTVRLDVTGPPDSLRVEATASASAVLVGTTRLRGLDASVDGLLGSGAAVRRARSSVELDRLTVAGVDVRVSNLEGSWSGDTLAVDGDVTVDDRRDVRFTVRAQEAPGARHVAVERLDVRVDDDRWTLRAAPSLTWGDDGIVVDSLVLAADGQALEIDGRFDPRGRSDLGIRVDSLRLGGITDLLGWDGLDGTLSARADLTGPSASPRLEAGAEAALSWRDGPVSRVAVTAEADSLRLALDASVDAGEGGSITLTGDLPFEFSLGTTPGAPPADVPAAADVDLHLRSRAFAVSWIEPYLDPATARDLGGLLEIDARVTGPRNDPTLSGGASLRDGRVGLPTLGVTWEDAVMGLTLEGQRARIDSARVRSDDGHLTLGGTVSLPELSLGAFDLSADMDRFRAIHNDAWRVRVSGTAALRGTTDEPRVEGDLRLVETDLYLDDALSSGASVQPVRLTDEQIRELEEYLGYPVRTPRRERGALFEALSLDVQVTTTRDTWVRRRANPELEIQLAGEATVTKAPGDSLRLDGRVEAVSRRSWVEQFGRRFSIAEGVVDLRGTVPETRVDVRAVYRVPSRGDTQAEATITLDVEGTPQDLSLTLGSEPEMENADIVSYLATGRPASESLDLRSDGDGQGGAGLGAIGSEFALGQVTGLVEGLAAEGVGLDVVEIRTDGLRGATLVAGRFISPRVYVGFQQPVGRNADDADGRGEVDRSRVELEIQALRWLLLNMEAGNSAFTFLLRFRHAF